jgi:hypothetical protein
MRKLANFAGFQAVWLACVISAASGKPWIGLAVFAAVMTAHLWLTRERAAELKLLGAAAAIGLAAESALLAWGGVRFPGGGLPVWMIALWVNFASTLRLSLEWLSGRYALAAVLGAVAGPLSYLGGERLGAITVESPLAIGIEWAIATPLLVYLKERTS